jgi:hypothetical protein
MHLLATAGVVVLTSVFALSLKRPRIDKITFPVSAPYDVNCVGSQ